MLAPLLGIAGVTFSAPAAPASRLLPLLGKAAGVSLEADARLGPEVLLVHVEGVPPGDLMARIAQATGGEWERRAEGYRLTLSGAAAAKQGRAETIARGRRWLAAGRRYRAQRQTAGFSDMTRGEVETVLNGLSAEALGELKPGRRLVFSTRPTAMQRTLPASALDGVDLTHLRAPFPPAPEGFPKPGPATGALLELRAGSTGSDLQATLVAADAKGAVLGIAATSLWAPPFDESDPDAVLPRPEAKVDPTAEERRLAADFAATMPDINDGRGYSGINDEIYPSVEYSDADLTRAPIGGRHPNLADPVGHEPLALLAGPLLEHLAEGQHSNLVADLSDATFSVSATLLKGGGVSAKEAARELRHSGTDVVCASGWLVASPRHPVEARETRLNRAALGLALRTLAKGRTLTLDEEAAYVAAQPMVDPRRSPEGPLFAAFDPVLAKRVVGDYDTGGRDLLILHHVLGHDETARARTFGSLPPAARSVLERLVFDGEAGPQRRLGPREGEVYRDVPMQGPYSLALERTSYWGDGIPAGATLTVRELSESAWFGLAPNGGRPWITPHAGGIGLRGAADGSFVALTGLPRLERYAPGTLRKVGFDLSDGSGTSLRRVLMAGAVDPRAPDVPYADLPKELRDATESTEAAQQKMIEGWQRRRKPGKP